MTLRSDEMARLWSDSSKLHGRNHKAWLAEAMNAVRTTRDPRLAIELLEKLRRGQRSKNERDAIADVGRWLEQRVRREPRVPLERLLVELGWLRRMAVTRQGAHKVARNGGGADHGRRLRAKR